jgi:hypothetical protein
MVAETVDIATNGAIGQSCFDVEEVLQEATMAEKVALLAGEASFLNHKVYQHKAKLS